MPEPITEEEAKSYLRLEDDDPGIGDLPKLIKAARQRCERFLNASIVTQTRELILNGFPPYGIPLPNGPVKSIDKIEYIDNDGAPQTVANWILSQDVVTPAYGEAWPSTRAQIGAVTITYIAGMMEGSPETLDEEDINQGIRLHLADAWDQRSIIIVGASIALSPQAQRYLEPYRRNMGI